MEGLCGSCWSASSHCLYGLDKYHDNYLFIHGPGGPAVGRPFTVADDTMYK